MSVVIRGGHDSWKKSQWEEESEETDCNNESTGRATKKQQQKSSNTGFLPAAGAKRRVGGWASSEQINDKRSVSG